MTAPVILTVTREFAHAMGPARAACEEQTRTGWWTMILASRGHMLENDHG